MSRLLRVYDDAGFIHVVLRGNNQQKVFIDEMDKRKIINEMRKYSNEMKIDVIAFCIMDNHIHIILHDDNLEFSKYMKKIEIAYVSYFNVKYNRCGHLFQDRFFSKPITSDSQLLAAVRYVHLNPQEAGICSFEQYAWSSYIEYIFSSSVCETELILGMFNDKNSFREFHLLKNNYSLTPFPPRVTDSDAIRIISEITNSFDIKDINDTGKETRNRILSEIKAHGLSVRQISRITGISTGVIHRA